MQDRLARLHEAWIANRKAIFWLLATYIPVSMGVGCLGYWALHTWILGFIVSGAYIVGLMFIWVKILYYVRYSD